MRDKELQMRKEVALTRIKIARTELALYRLEVAEKTNKVGSVVDLATSVLHRGRAERPRREGRIRKWARYATMAWSVIQAALGVRRAAKVARLTGEAGSEVHRRRPMRLRSELARETDAPGSLRHA